MKYHVKSGLDIRKLVALFTRAWIEINICQCFPQAQAVALFTRAWIEIVTVWDNWSANDVALFTRAWIEIVQRL